MDRLPPSRSRMTAGSVRAAVLATLIVATFADRASSAPGAPGDTAWTSNGIRLCPTSGDQDFVVSASDGAGGSYFAWQDSRSGTWSLYCQRLDANGRVVFGWPADGLALCSGTSSVRYPVIEPDGSGGVLLAWMDRRANGASSLVDLYAQRLAPDGTRMWGSEGSRVTPSPSAYSCFDLTGDGLGGAFLAWQDERLVSGTDHVFVQHLDGSGARLWAAAGLSSNVDTTATHDQWCPQVIPDGTGGLITAWTDLRLSPTDKALFAQRISSAGALQWGDSGLVVATGLGSTGGLRALLEDQSGGAIVHSSAAKLYRLGPTGLHLWGAAGVSTGLASVAVSDGASGAFTAFSDPVSHVVRAEHFSAAGSPLWGLPTIASGATAKFIAGSPPARDGAGGLLLTWQDYRTGTGTSPPERYADIYTQRVSSVGTPATGWPASARATCTADSAQVQACVAPDADGGAIVAWVDRRAPASQIYAARVAADGIVPALVSAEVVSVAADGVVLRWMLADRSIASVTVERAEDGGAWLSLATLSIDGSRRVTLEDRDVRSGASYRYRLRVWQAGAEVRLGELTVAIPTLPPLSVTVRSNPSITGLELQVTTSFAEPSCLEVLDVAGRRVLRRDLGRLAAGRHVLSVESREALNSGLYLVRVTQGGLTVSAKAVVMR